MNYSEKLLSPHWQRKRLEVMQRDNFQCMRCKNGDVTLNVHHIKYIPGREPWEYKLDNFETLCQPCHQKEHIDDEEKELAKFEKPSIPRAYKLWDNWNTENENPEKVAELKQAYAELHEIRKQLKVNSDRLKMEPLNSDCILEKQQDLLKQRVLIAAKLGISVN